jgi:hypothetical protein
MIYCVIPPDLADELYDRLVEHYSANPNVQVIVDRRQADRRAGELEVSAENAERRVTRDRRRARPGSFPPVYDGSNE